MDDTTEPPKHDHPLHGRPHPFDKLHPALYVSEFVGTFLLVFVGLSVVVALWGKGAPLAWLPLQPGARRFLNGTLFGTTGALIAFSHCGKVSGAHINPAVTLAFWLEDKIQWRDALCYVVAQIAGGVAGGVALLIWGRIGASDGYGASVPDAACSALGADRGRDRLHLPARRADLRHGLAQGDAVLDAAHQPAALRGADLARGAALRRLGQSRAQPRPGGGERVVARAMGVFRRALRRRRARGRAQQAGGLGPPPSAARRGSAISRITPPFGRRRKAARREPAGATAAAARPGAM